MMINLKQLENMDKERIKMEFGEEMEVEIIPLNKMPERKAEPAKKLDTEIPEDFDGLFAPPKNGHKAFLLVGYNEENKFDLYEKYHHELQHVVDYFEVMKALGEMPPYWNYYSEFNAGWEGFLKVNMAVLTTMVASNEDCQRHILESKERLNTVLKKTPKTIFDMLCHVARIQAIAQLEKKVDYSVYEGIPRAVVELADFIYDYEPTREWYAKFKETIENIPVKKESE